MKEYSHNYSQKMMRVYVERVRDDVRNALERADRLMKTRLELKTEEHQFIKDMYQKLQKLREWLGDF
jgi:hypothetical protein